MIRQILFLAGLFLCMPQGGKSQPIDELLQQIEQNNKSLQALRQENEAARQEIRSQNNLEDPSVEYSPFYTKGTDGMSSSELVVSQGFDFPTRYAARRKSGRPESEYLDRQYLVARRDLLLGARLQCLDLIRLNRTRELLEARLRNAGELLALFEKRLEEGDASILEVNKIRMERMNATTELAQNESARQQALAALQAMNGDQAVAFGVTEYPEAPAVGEYDRLRDELLAAVFEQFEAQVLQLPAECFMLRLRERARKAHLAQLHGERFDAAASGEHGTHRHDAAVADHILYVERLGHLRYRFRFGQKYEIFAGPRACCVANRRKNETSPPPGGDRDVGSDLCGLYR